MTQKGIFIPPVLRNTRFLGIEQFRYHMCVVFASTDPSVHDGVVRVAMMMKTKEKEIIYIYSVYDSETHTMRHYKGPHGDMEKDEWTDVSGSPPQS